MHQDEVLGNNRISLYCMKCRDRKKYIQAQILARNGAFLPAAIGMCLEPARNVEMTATDPERRRIGAFTLASPRSEEHGPLSLAVFGNGPC